MRNRMSAPAILAMVLFAVMTAASGCGSGSPRATSTAATGKPTAGHSTSPATSPATRFSSPSTSGGLPNPGAAGPNIPAVALGTKFSPDTLQLGVGQQFMVTVSSSVRPSGSGIDGDCTAATAAAFTSTMLSLRCDGNSYLYTVRKAGSAALSVTVRPACSAGSVCPMWITVATLRLTITQG
jgi:hypothetical protein